ncbi:CU044_2847 family protein [Streptomyces sp. NPDC058301]|uniref:CU044_2847 family protein n=1 Tax=Streptomyces sp. NPDC058301 TaxID=3346436 RepID=UPI0036E85086
MPHDDYMELILDDGARVRVEVTPVGGVRTAPADRPDDDLPSGVGGATPVGRGGERVAALATDTLAAVLRPLGPFLQQVHDSVRGIPDPPDSLAVGFGLQIGQDLKLGVVGANGQASMTVSATWQLRPGDSAGTGTGTGGN